MATFVEGVRRRADSRSICEQSLIIPGIEAVRSTAYGKVAVHADAHAAFAGPVGHRREMGIVNWFFLDPDEYRVEVEARYPTGEEAAEVIERGKAGRQEEMGLYGGDRVLKT